MIVSVCMITYGQDKYIRQSIKGILMQKVGFDIELIIADDCSTDKTQEIVQDIIRNHPNGQWIKYTRHSQNKGMLDNLIWALGQCRGKYIALCEGDDYWIDQNKLQHQVAILEANKNCSFCFHRALRIFDTSRPYEIYPDLENNIIDSEQLFGLYTIPMASVVFRSKINFWFPANHIQPDFLLLCKLMSNGDAYFLPEVMSVYRKHANGISYNNQSYNYLKRRVECLHIEVKSTEFTPDVRRQIKRIFKSHTKQLISKYSDQFSFVSLLKYRYWLLSI